MTRSPTFRRLLLSALASISVAGCFPLRQGSFSPPTTAEVGPVLDNYGEAIVPAHGVIVVQGDDLIYGVAPGRSGRPGINGSDIKRANTTITETLRQVLKPASVVNLGYPGDTAAMGEQRWADQPVGDLLVLSYGFGDAFAHTPLPQYHRALRDMVRRAHAQGAAVFLLTTPPLLPRSAAAVVASPATPVAPTGRGGRKRGAASQPLQTGETTTGAVSPPGVELASTVNGALEQYRMEMRKVGAEESAEVFEPSAQLTQFKIAPTDTVAQTPVIYRAVAGGLAPYIKLVQDPARGRRTRKPGRPDRAQP